MVTLSKLVERIEALCGVDRRVALEPTPDFEHSVGSTSQRGTVGEFRMMRRGEDGRDGKDPRQT
jgi:hypothetical protein